MFRYIGHVFLMEGVNHCQETVFCKKKNITDQKNCQQHRGVIFQKKRIAFYFVDIYICLKTILDTVQVLIDANIKISVCFTIAVIFELSLTFFNPDFEFHFQAAFQLCNFRKGFHTLIDRTTNCCVQRAHCVAQ